jgi:homoserine dehydrogenase
MGWMTHRPEPLTVVQLGFGAVGRALIDLLIARGDVAPVVRLRGLADRTGLAWRPTGWSAAELARWRAAKAGGATVAHIWADRADRSDPTDPPDRLLPAEHADALWQADDVRALLAAGRIALVDVTAERAIYPTILAAREAGAHVVLCNKWALAVPQDDYERLLAAGSGQLRRGTTVGAALPVLSTLDDLVATGDTVHEIEAVVSGTLGCVTSAADDGVPFSVAVRAAYDLGYTEPDPRDDLAGIDARRKALILARALGQRLDLVDVRVESLLPAELASGSLPTFWSRLGELDVGYAERVAATAANGQVLRYMAVINADGAAVGLRAVPVDSAAGRAYGTESVFTFRTRRYGDQPLTVRGRGAGAELTASGVLADLLAVAACR